MDKYDHVKTEKKWIKRWEETKLNETNLDSVKKPYYNLMMFPYPSAEGLHVGNMYAFTGSDIWGRFHRMKGFDVFEPIGLDGFGIHSENYAIKIKEHIKNVSQRTEKHFYEQLHMIGNRLDWSRTVESYKPEYYKWTQWLFTQMFEHGLAYRKKAVVNWCPSCKTVLSDEQVESGKCERCKSETVTKNMEQWFWRITDYAERLVKNLEWINWSPEVKLIQKNWIGKSEGIEINYEIKDIGEKVKVFTTRPDTNFGATFIVAAPDSEFVALNIEKFPNKAKCQKYIADSRKKSEAERISEGRKKTGVFTGLYALNNLNGKELPIYIGDFVLATVGTGVVVGVPGHDKRDFEFAKEMGIEIVRVVVGKDGDKSKITDIKQVQEQEGMMINSGFLDGLDIHKATKVIMDYLEKKGWGERCVKYKLRDWCISRQRYWGPPIPMIYCEKCGWNPVKEKDLPVLLPDIPKLEDILPDGSGKGPLAKFKGFVDTKCPKCGGQAERETDVSDPFVDSCWFFLRYPSTEFNDSPFEEKRTKKWLPVDMYIGGKEHAVLHLLYSRFVTMALKDWGFIDFEEPFERFFGHGLLIKEGAKMSKSKGNVVNPDEYIGKFGADAVRLYLMFLGDFRQGGDWRDSGMQGMHRFIKKVWGLFEEEVKAGKGVDSMAMAGRTIIGVGKDINGLRYNTAIAKIMEFVNWYKENIGRFTKDQRRQALETLCLVLAPFAPFITEELWEKIGNKFSIHNQIWPEVNEASLKDREVTVAVQINGKLRGTLKIQVDASKDELVKKARGLENVKKYLSREEKKVIVVRNKIVNFVL